MLIKNGYLINPATYVEEYLDIRVEDGIITEIGILDAEENEELAMQYGIMQAPTLVVVSEDSSKKYVNVSNIKKYVMETV